MTTKTPKTGLINQIINQIGAKKLIKIAGAVTIIAGVGSIISAGTFLTGSATIDGTGKSILEYYSSVGVDIDNYFNYGMLRGFIVGPIEILIGLGLIKCKGWSRKTFLVLLIYYFLHQILYEYLYETRYLIPHLHDSEEWITRSYFTLIVTLLSIPLWIYVFTRPKLKSEFK